MSQEQDIEKLRDMFSGSERKLSALKKVLGLRGANATTIERSIEAIKQAQTLLARVESLTAALRRIVDLRADKDSAEGDNEWGEADCFGHARTIANAALTHPTQADGEKR